MTRKKSKHVAAKHTPGPWDYDPETGDVETRGECWRIVTVDIPTGVDRQFAEEQAEFHANGFLIAAAPELLRQLEALSVCFMSALLAVDDEQRALGMSIIAEVDAIVAKAKGVKVKP